MTNRKLKEFLNTLTEEQLNQEIMIQSEDKGYSFIRGEVLTEDCINPSGEGAEPISMYLPSGCGYDENDPFDVTDEPVVLRKGQVVYYNY
jgi:hypothetical protein